MKSNYKSTQYQIIKLKIKNKKNIKLKLEIKIGIKSETKQEDMTSLLFQQISTNPKEGGQKRDEKRKKEKENKGQLIHVSHHLFVRRFQYYQGDQCLNIVESCMCRHNTMTSFHTHQQSFTACIPLLTVLSFNCCTLI